MSMKKIIIDKIIKSIEEEPETWRIGEYTVFRTHIIKNDEGFAIERVITSVWIAGGKVFCRIYEPHEIKLGFFEKRKLWKACEKLRLSLFDIKSGL